MEGSKFDFDFELIGPYQNNGFDTITRICISQLEPTNPNDVTFNELIPTYQVDIIKETTNPIYDYLA